MIGKFLSFIKSPPGMTLSFVASVMIGFYFLGEYRKRHPESAKQNPGTEAILPTLNPHKPQLEDGADWTRTETGDQLPEWAEQADYEPFKPAREATPPPARTVLPPKAAPQPPVLPSLLHVSLTLPEPPSTPEPAAPPRLFAPIGTLIPCELVLTVESGAASAPVIAVVTQNIYHQGQLIIPIATEIHGPGSAKRRRDRILIDGGWQIILGGGRELTVSGTALHRSYDMDSETFGVNDGSLGIQGTLEESIAHRELKLLASTAIGALTRSQKETFQTIFGSVPEGSLSNGILEGGSSVADLYAKRLLEGAEGDGRYVKVPAGTEFYLYCRDKIVPGTARVEQAPSTAAREPADESLSALLQAHTRQLKQLSHSPTP